MPFVTPTDFHTRIAHVKTPMTDVGAKIFGVEPQKFCSWYWQMKHQIQESRDFEKLDLSAVLPDTESHGFTQLKEKFHAGVSPYSLACMNLNDPSDPIRLQLMPRLDELTDQHGVLDPLQEKNNSPIKELVHVYPDRIAWCVAQLCPVYCRYCFRKHRDGEPGLHFNPKIIAQGLEYIRNHPQIRDVLITGGDPFIASDATLENLLQGLRAIPHVEIIRFGTRTPVALPYRITTELCDMLARYHPIWVNTHFNHPNELTPEAASAIDTLLSRGIPVGNQSVFLKDVNDSFDVMSTLLSGLVRLRVRPYYIYHPQIVDGTAHLRIPLEQGLDIMRRLRGQVTGFSIPQYVLDTPTGKVPLSAQHVLSRDGDYVMVKQLNGEPWAEPNPLGDYIPDEPLNQGHKLP